MRLRTGIYLRMDLHIYQHPGLPDILVHIPTVRSDRGSIKCLAVQRVKIQEVICVCFLPINTVISGKKSDLPGLVRSPTPEDLKS